MVYAESFQWQDLVINNIPIALTPASVSFRERLSLDPKFDLKKPDGTLFQPELAGPVYDLMTFYADIRVAAHSGRLNRAGDHYYFAHGQPNSWADTYVGFVIAEDCIDFDLTLLAVDNTAGEATLLVKHVPPAKQCVNLPAPWMQVPVSDKPNNWVQVIRIPNNGGFLVEVGREDFYDTIKIELGTGKMRG